MFTKTFTDGQRIIKFSVCYVRNDEEGINIVILKYIWTIVSHNNNVFLIGVKC